MGYSSWDVEGRDVLRDVQQAKDRILGMTGYDNWESRFWDVVRKEYNNACVHMDVDQLTPDQQFAVAVIHGVEWNMLNDGRVPVTEKCSISVVEGKWHVATKPASIV